MQARHFESYKQSGGEYNRFARCHSCRFGFWVHYQLDNWNLTEPCEAECPYCQYVNKWAVLSIRDGNNPEGPRTIRALDGSTVI